MLCFHLTTAASTNDAAQRLALAHPGRGLLVSARTQTRGRGRHGRTWHSPPGGAWFSVAWPVAADRDLAHYGPAPLRVGLAVAEALDAIVHGPRPRTPDADPARAIQLKWPNDVLLAGRKLAGILCETAVQPGRAPTLILGVGINVRVDLAALGTALRQPATSLHEHLGAAPSVQAVIDAAAARIVEAMTALDREGLSDEALAALDARLAWRGETVSLRIGARTIRGRLDGLERDGRLRLATSAGSRSFRSGELTRSGAWAAAWTHDCFLQTEVLA